MNPKDVEWKAIEELQKVLYYNQQYSHFIQFISKPREEFLFENPQEQIQSDNNTSIPRLLIWKTDTSLSKRISYLQYGFGARTKQILDNLYPKTKSTFPEEEWNQIGQEYSETHAIEYGNINEMGLKFPEFLQVKKIHHFSHDSASLERLFYLSRIAPFNKYLTFQEFSTLDDSTEIQLRDDIHLKENFLNIENDKWVKSKEIMFYLIHRDNTSYPNCLIYANSISEKLFLFLRFFYENSSKSIHLELLHNNFSEKEISEGLLFCLHHGLLILTDSEKNSR